MNDKFLNVFKELENELRGTLGQSVLEYENALPDGEKKEKLKICRIVRNYLSHQDKKFIIASEEMCAFLDDLLLTIIRMSRTVANELTRQKTVKVNEYLKNILPLLVKSVVPVEDNGKIIYLITEKEYLVQLNKGIKKFELPKRLPKLTYVSKDTKMDTLTSGTYIVTANGKSDGKYVGLCIV